MKHVLFPSQNHSQGCISHSHISNCHKLSSGWQQVARSCVYGNESLGSIKWGNFLTSWGPIRFSKRILNHEVHCSESIIHVFSIQTISFTFLVCNYIEMPYKEQEFLWQMLGSPLFPRYCWDSSTQYQITIYYNGMFNTYYYNCMYMGGG